MNSLEESVVTAMDGSDPEIFPYLPYILQDFWEIGASPEVIIELIRKHAKNDTGLRILDLGCGKGAVSIKVADALGCKCLGIDGIRDFIEYAQDKARAYRVEELCQFEVGDIRLRVKDLTDYDVIILGAIGHVFGDYFETLSTLSKSLKAGGLIIIDDGYHDDNSAYIHPGTLTKNELLQQMDKAGMKLIDEVFVDDLEHYGDVHDEEFDHIVKRCHELIRQYPEKRALFEGFIDKQREEYDVMETKVICSTMVVKG